jgi:homoserine O-succinyltransferase
MENAVSSLSTQTFSHGTASGPRLRVGLVNNMPDAALVATERQFAGLLGEAAGGLLELVLLHIPEIPRSAGARDYLQARYRPVAEIEAARLDALVVTGADPGRGPLSAAPFWPALQRLVDWAEATRRPALWSCLAAHAAAEHLDGLRRERLAAKACGVFACAPAAPHALTEGLEASSPIPHSRWNALAEADLAGAGYEIVTRGEAVGADVFVRKASPHFLFCQGHPEYEADSLALEHRRDFRAWLRGEAAGPPPVPPGAFDTAVEQRLARLAAYAFEAPSPKLMAQWPRGGAAPAAAQWRAFAVRLYRNWLAAAGAPVPLFHVARGRHGL